MFDEEEEDDDCLVDEECGFSLDENSMTGFSVNLQTRHVSKNRNVMTSFFRSVYGVGLKVGANDP